MIYFPRNSISGSAVCAFSLEDILHAFNGPFKGQDDINANWLPVASTKVPEPRPGQVWIPSDSFYYIYISILLRYYKHEEKFIYVSV